MAYLGRRRAILQKERDQNGGVGRECIERGVLLGRVQEDLAKCAVDVGAALQPEAVAGVLELKRDRHAAHRQAAALAHGARLRSAIPTRPSSRTPSDASAARATSCALSGR